MINTTSKLTIIIAALGLASCGARTANLTPLTTSLDSKLSCTHLNGEYQNLDKRIIELTDERDSRRINNVGLLLSSPLFLDLSGTEKKEATSIVERQEQLRVLMQSRSCPEYAAIVENKASLENTIEEAFK